jgi:hypothetical protein
VAGLAWASLQLRPTEAARAWRGLYDHQHLWLGAHRVQAPASLLLPHRGAANGVCLAPPHPQPSLHTQVYSLAEQNRFYKKAAAGCLRAVAKHSPQLAQAVIDSGSLDALVTCLEEFDPGGWHGLVPPMAGPAAGAIAPVPACATAATATNSARPGSC